MPHTLIVDANALTRDALAQAMNHNGMTTAVATDLRTARIQLVRQIPEIVFIDSQLPDGKGTDLFEDLELYPNIKVIIMTDHATVESAVSALKMGAADYLTKPIDSQRAHTILNQIPHKGSSTVSLQAQAGRRVSPRESESESAFGLMLGRSALIRQVYEQIGCVAPTSASVLLIGESGTGKELAARTVHMLSQRSKNTFLAVNCGAIAPNLTESEMFGHERGAFTGADRQHKGYFEQADGGTLFLDEITEMPLQLQVKLLRVLETNIFMRVGATKEITTDMRVIAATNRDPEEAIHEGRLRFDLYHRLNVFPIYLPPLRERDEDIQLLAQRFLDELNQHDQTQKTFSEEIKKTLLSYAWPGNVRELKNYVQRLYIMSGAKSGNMSAVPVKASPSKFYSCTK